MLATLTALKVGLKVSLSDTSSDQLLQLCLDAAERAVRTFCKRPGLQSPAAAWTEYQDGSGTDRLVLRHYPVTALTSVNEDVAGYYGTPAGAFASTTGLTEGTDFVLDRKASSSSWLSDSGILFRLKSSNPYTLAGIMPSLPYGTLVSGPPGPRWLRSIGGIKIVYAAGYPAGAVPDDLANAVLQVAAYIKRVLPMGGLHLSSESLGGYSYSLAMTALNGLPELGSARQILSQFRDQRIG